MKKKVTYEEKTVRTVVVELEFPNYRKHTFSTEKYHTVTLSRWDCDGTETRIERSVHTGLGTLWFEASRHPRESVFDDGQDYVLGLGEHACTEAEFNNMFVELEAFIHSTRRTIK